MLAPLFPPLRQFLLLPQPPSQAIADLNSLILPYYNLIKVCEYKNVVKHFPHEARDLSGLVLFLGGGLVGVAWETQYVLLAWLSIVVLMPF